MANAVTFGRATPSDLDAVLAVVDAEFVAGRGRTGSFRTRFPSMYTADCAGDIVLARAPDGLAGVAAIKRRTMTTGDRSIRLAMIGGVWIRPALRGQGLGQRLMGEVERTLSGGSVDVAVLWTGQPAFYEKSGWRAKDAGLFGTATAMPPSAASKAAVVKIDDAVAGHLEKIRARQPFPIVARTLADYRTLPSPAECVECIIAEPAAYALVGRAGDAVYVYEMAGDAARFGGVLAEAGRGAQRVFINDHPATASHAWLSSHARVDWRPQHLAMWKVFADWVHWGQLDCGPISLMDRI